MFNIVVKQQHQKLNVFRQWLGIIENDDVLHKRKIPNSNISLSLSVGCVVFIAFQSILFAVIR